MRGTSLSATLAELVARGLGQLDEPLTLTVDKESGFPVVSIGSRITSDDVAKALDE